MTAQKPRREMERKQINTQSGFNEEIRVPKQTQQSYEMTHTVTQKTPNTFTHQKYVIFCMLYISCFGVQLALGASQPKAQRPNRVENRSGSAHFTRLAHFTKPDDCPPYKLLSKSVGHAESFHHTITKHTQIVHVSSCAPCRLQCHRSGS